MKLLVQRLLCAAVILAVPLFLLLFSYLHNQNFSCIETGNGDQHLHQLQHEESCRVSQEPIKKENQRKKLWASKNWKEKVDSMLALFRGLDESVVVSHNTKAICISAGIGQEVMALKQMGVEGAIGIEVVESPPLVIRGDAHKHPFADATFDLEFSSHLSDALFPARFVSEMERTLKPGGHALILVPFSYPIDQINALFNSSQLMATTGSQNSVGQADESSLVDEAREAREIAYKAIARCLYANGLPFNLVRSPYWKEMVPHPTITTITDDDADIIPTHGVSTTSGTFLGSNDLELATVGGDRTKK